jgi:iron complex transport system ATP-binding protein
MLEIQSLSIAYENHMILHDLSLSIHPGEITVLIGPNGAGKSTLIRAISGVIKPQTGKILVNGHDLALCSTGERARYMAVVPQARSLPPAFSVYQAVLLGRTPYLGWLGQANASDHARVQQALIHTGATQIAQRRIGDLSGGEQQRVLLARALAQDTPILLLDEPTTHLDLQHQSTLLNLVRQLASRQNLAVLMVLHDLNLAGLYADRIALITQGRLQALGAPAEVLTESTLSATYQLPVHVIPHPDYGVPLILPDGRLPVHPTNEKASYEQTHFA